MCILAISENADPAYRLPPKRVTADKDVSRYYDVILSDERTEGVIRQAQGVGGGGGGVGWAVAASEEHDKGDGRQRMHGVYSSHDTGWEPWFEDEGVPTTPATLSFRP